MWIRGARAVASLVVATTVSCGGPESAPPPSSAPAASAGKPLTIGFSMDTLKEERWQRDKDLVTKRCAELGVTLLVQAASGNDALQNSQAEGMLTQGVDVLLVAPHNGKTAATIVDAAHRAGVPVIAYDRLINDADLDLYVSFDNEQVGVLQAEAITRRAPTGSYVVIGGAPTDNNALLFHKGQLSVLDPLVKKGDVTIVVDQMSRDWQASEALKTMENALTRTGNKVDAVVAANDGLAGGAIQALAEQRLAGKVPISGQDAELSACQRIVVGTQTMTVYKPIARLAAAAVDAAVRLARKQPLEGAGRTVPNGRRDVPSILLAPVVVDRDNLAATVIKDGYHRVEDVYRDVPKEQWPR